MFRENAIIIAHLVAPKEKFWGVLLSLDPSGVSMRSINVEAFDDWVAEIAGEEEASLGLATMFVPMSRVERIFVDERIGEVESYRQRFTRRLGVDPTAFLGIDSPS